MWIDTPEPNPSETPEVIYLLSDNPVVQNLLTVFGFITALGGAVVVVWAAIRFIVRPIRAAWRDRVQLDAEIASGAHHGSIVAPRGLTFPRVTVRIRNLSLVRTLPKAEVTFSTLPSIAPSEHGDFKPERTIEVMPPLTVAHPRGRNTSDLVAPDNWQLVDEFTVTLSWEVKRITATRSKRTSKSWTFRVSHVKGLRESY